jgi:hypothetical protein
MNMIETIRQQVRRAGLLLAALTLGATLAHAQCGPIYPIAFSQQTLANATVGQTLNDIWNGQNAGNFGWLSWTGDPGEPTLVDSLTQPGDVETYKNPADVNDHILASDKWAQGRPGVANGKHVRSALNALKNVPITVPVWDTVTGSGNNVQYHIVGFATVKITDYQLPQQNRISCVFLGYYTCGGGSPN